MRTSLALSTLAVLATLNAGRALAADELLETLAQKGVITMEEYEKLKTQRKTAPALNLDDGFRIASGDGAWTLQPGVLQQLDGASYSDDVTDLSSGTEIRRSRLSVGGSFLKDWQYRVEYEFASGSAALTDAYVSYNALKPVVITVGQFKPSFGMEALSQDKSATFMERALPFYLVSPLIVRAPGVQVATSWANGSLAGGLFGEPLGNAQAGDEGFGAAARVTWAPYLQGTRVVHLGAAAQWRVPTQDNSTNTTGPRFETVRFRAKPESNILSQRFVDTGEIADVEDFMLTGVELAAAVDAFSLQAEYQQVGVARDNGADDVDFSSSYVQLAYTLTGEVRPYRVDRGVFEGVKPAKPFGAGGWGAFEVAARYSEIDLSDGAIVGGRERNATAALSWYLNPFVRISANYVKVLDVEGGAFDGEEPEIWQARVQLAI